MRTRCSHNLYMSKCPSNLHSHTQGNSIRNSAYTHLVNFLDRLQLNMTAQCRLLSHNDSLKHLALKASLHLTLYVILICVDGAMRQDILLVKKLGAASIVQLKYYRLLLIRGRICQRIIYWAVFFGAAIYRETKICLKGSKE